LWRSVVEGDGEQGFRGPYEAVSTGWRPWTGAVAWPNPGDPDFLEDLRTEIEGRWVLLVVIGADEAGNVTPWPDALAATGNRIEVLEDAVTLRNWYRLYVAGPGEERSKMIDTRIKPSFWHERVQPGSDGEYTRADGEYLGSRYMLTLPRAGSGQALAGKISLTCVLPPSLPENVDVGIHWEIRGPGLNGDVLRMPVPIDGRYHDVVWRPAGDWSRAVWRPWLGLVFAEELRLKRELHCTFEAWTVVEQGGIQMLVDATPARFPFVVTSSVGALVLPKDSSDQQPVRIQRRGQ